MGLRAKALNIITLLNYFPCLELLPAILHEGTLLVHPEQ